MAGFWGALGTVAAKGAVAYGEQQQDNRRALLIEKARQDALARRAAQDARQVEQDRIAADDRKIAIEEREQQRLRQRLADEASGIVHPSTTITATSPAPRLSAGAQSRSPLTTPVTEGSLGAIPRTRVTQTPGGYDPTRNKTLIAQLARDQETERRQIEREGRQNAQQDKRDRRREAGLDRRDGTSGGTRESLTRFDAPLQRAVHGAIAQMKAKGITNPTEEQIQAGALNIIGADKTLRPYFDRGAITRDMVWGAVGARADRIHEKPPEEEDQQKLDRLAGGGGGAKPVAAPPRSGGPGPIALPKASQEEYDAAADQADGDTAKIAAILRRMGRS